MARFLSAGALAEALASSFSLVNGSRASVAFGLRRFSSRPEKVQLFELVIDGEGSASEVEVLGMRRRLEDAGRAIVVRRSAPYWLPFIPGSSYWVPPRSNPIADEEMMSSIAARGWPTDAFFVEGAPLNSRKKTQERTHAQSEDDEES